MKVLAFKPKKREMTHEEILADQTTAWMEPLYEHLRQPRGIPRW